MQKMYFLNILMILFSLHKFGGIIKISDKNILNIKIKIFNNIQFLEENIKRKIKKILNR